MSGVGGDITELLRRLGVDELVDEAERAGLAPQRKRMKCPWAGCEDKGPERKRSAVASVLNGHPRVHCYACNKAGDLVDLLERTRALSRAEAMAHVQGRPVSDRPRPELRVVGSRPPDEAGKLLPSEVQRIWDELAKTSDLCRPYLVKRSLVGAIDAGLVRFATEDSKSKEVALHAAKNRRIAVLLSDVVGNPRGIQLRVAGEPRGKDPKVLSVKGSVTSRAFFGQPAAIAGAPVVAVAEGMADTLALQLWAEQGAVVVGAAGMSFLPKLSEELELAGVDVEEKLFALFPQNDDRHAPNSRSLFLRLAQLLRARGARVVMVETPAEFKDLAEWRNAEPSAPWPPPKLAEAFADEPGDDQERKFVDTPGHALPARAQYTAEKYAQNLTTLAALLDDPASRHSLLHRRGELSFCKMTHSVLVDGSPLADKELTKVRLELEQFARSTDGKPLQFKAGDIRDVLTTLASRREVHPIQEWVKGLEWNGTHLLETELPRILGHEPHGFDAMLLRRWAVSAVARAIEPGCKVDTVLILKGGGGVGKTKFFKALGGDWYTASNVVPGDKDGMLVMRKKWIIEWGELDDMKRSRSVQATKRFLSLQHDDFREPYGRDVVTVERHCVIVGTTNEQEILPHDDEGGHRRFWPVEVLTTDIDLRWVEKHREQLFAEALAIYNGASDCAACAVDPDKRCGDHRWWLTKEETALLVERHKAYETSDAWHTAIARWLAEQLLAEVTTEQVLAHAVLVPIEHQTNPAKQRVGGVLRQLGWERGKSRRDGTVVNVFRRPEVSL